MNVSGDARNSGPPAGAVPPQGWVLFDGACGFCARWVPHWAPTLRSIGLGVMPLQAPGVRERTGLDAAALLEDIRIVFTDGRQLAGAAVYRWVMRRVWWAYPAFVLSVTPGLRPLFDRAYRAFADHRMHLSASCRLDPPGGR